MRDIYLIDFENVASEGLSGITYLAPEDEVIIFYSNNSKSLSMKMHILIGKSVCKLDYFEASVGGKNALDHQISTWLGYLVGTNAAERNYYIVSRDMGYKFVASFWADTPMKPSVRCVESIRAAGRIERSRQLQREAAAKAAAAAVLEEQAPMLQSPEPVPMLHAAPVAQPEPAPVPEVPAQELVQAEAPAPAIPVSEPAPAEPAAAVETAAPEVSAVPEPPVVPAEELEPDLPESRRSRNRGRRGRGRSKGRAEAAAEPEQPAVAEPQSPAPEPKPELKPEPKPEPKPELKPEPKPESKPEPKKEAQKSEPKKDAKHNAPKKKPEIQKDQSRLDLGNLIAPYPGLQEAHLQELINGNKRQILCNTLRKQLGQEKGLALYNEIKKSAWRS